VCWRTHTDEQLDQTLDVFDAVGRTPDIIAA